MTGLKSAVSFFSHPGRDAMLKVLFETPAGIMSMITIIGATVVICYWLYFVFKRHED